jgi:hypothetical protein
MLDYKFWMMNYELGGWGLGIMDYGFWMMDYKLWILNDEL